MNKKMFLEERRVYILNLLREKKRIEVKELSKLLGVSEVTIRNDLSHMEKQGLLKRTHGGAMLVNEREVAISYIHQAQVRIEQKQKIARVAASLIDDFDKVIIGTGSTIMQLGAFLGKKENITVITPSLPFAMDVSSIQGLTLILSGGYYRPTSGILFGPLFKKNMEKIFADKAFIGIKGINEEYVTDVDMIEAEVAADLLFRAKKRIILADSSKVGKTSFAVICATSDIHVLVTDEGADPQELDKIAKQGVEIILAK